MKEDKIVEPEVAWHNPLRNVKQYNLTLPITIVPVHRPTPNQKIVLRKKKSKSFLRSNTQNTLL